MSAGCSVMSAGWLGGVVWIESLGQKALAGGGCLCAEIVLVVVVKIILDYREALGCVRVVL